MNTIRIIMVMAAMLCAFAIKAQNESTKKLEELNSISLAPMNSRPKKNLVGFESGKSQNWFYSDRSASNLDIRGRGFYLGIVAEHRFNDYLSLSGKTLLYISDNRKFVKDEELIVYETKITPVLLHFSAQCMVGIPIDQIKPYILIGPNYRIPVQSENLPERMYGSNPDLALDLGIGFEKKCGDVTFSPEIRYTYGFRDINKSPFIQSLYQHQLSFGIVIKG